MPCPPKQLELHLEKARCALRVSSRRRRTQSWFERMRQIVDNAPEVTPHPRALKEEF